MEERRLVIPLRAISDLKGLFVNRDVPVNSSLCLSIIIEDAGVNLSEFAAYLGLIDRSYGRLSPLGIHAYSLRRKDQLKIGKFGYGSLWLEFIEHLANEQNIQILFIIYILLSCLPRGIERLSAAYKYYEGGRLLRERRKILRHKMRENPELNKLPDPRKNQLIAVIDELLLRGKRFLPKASRFAERYVRTVKIEVFSDSEEEANEKEHK